MDLVTKPPGLIDLGYSYKIGRNANDETISDTQVSFTFILRHSKQNSHFLGAKLNTDPVFYADFKLPLISKIKYKLKNFCFSDFFIFYVKYLKYTNFLLLTTTFNLSLKILCIFWFQAYVFLERRPERRGIRQ